MRIIFSFIFLFVILLSNAQCSDITKLREVYAASKNDIKSCKKLYDLSKNCSSKLYPVQFTYNVISHLMECHFIKNPFIKYKKFKESIKQLDNIIYLNPKCIEIRFLRYLTQLNSPVFLGYNANLDTDYKFITNNISSENEDLRSFILTILDNINNSNESNVSK
tara:strand:+ start:1670 stop:2161 length:492 start_codon:yes stop_codon:yes gene_type:complete